MKKLMTVLAVCAAATFSLAQVQSLNVVGFSSANVNGWALGSVAFDAIGGSSLAPNGGLTGNFTDGDLIELWNGSTYVTVVFGEVLDDSFVDLGYKAWLDPDTGYTAWTGTVDRAAGFWLSTKTNLVTFVGQVPPSGTNSVVLAHGWSLIGPGFPINILLNDATWTGIQAGDFVESYNGSSYVTVVYGEVLDDSFVDQGYEAWLDPDTGYTKMTSSLAGPCSSFWINLQGASGTASFSLNY